MAFLIGNKFKLTMKSRDYYKNGLKFVSMSYTHLEEVYTYIAKQKRIEKITYIIF